MARGAPLGVVNDETPLNGSDIDVGSRIGWTLRMARLTSARPPSLEALAAELGTSTARLHRLETGRLRDGSLIDGYERVLDRPAGSLRSPIDVLCRTFPPAPVDRDPGWRATTVEELSALTEEVAGDSVDGGAWLRWARSLSQPGAIGMPVTLAAELIERLISELGRAVGAAYPSRYEALSLLRSGPYGAVVLEVARQTVADPHVQVLFDLLSAVGEAVSADAVAWCLELLCDDRDRIVRGAALALENMGQISADRPFWGALVDPLTERLNASTPGSVAWECLSHLLRLVPREERPPGALQPAQPLAPSGGIENWSRTRLNAHWTQCEHRARSVTASLGLPEQPMLARLLFDIAISPYESRAVTSYMLLSASPGLADPAGEQLADLAEHQADPVIRGRAGRRLPGAVHGRFPALAASWLHSGDTDNRNHALLLAGAAGLRVPDDVLGSAIEGSATSRRAALYAVGMAGHLTDALFSHPDEEVAGGARWWARQGTRVLDAPHYFSSPGS